MQLILLGPPGSGKGTLAADLEQIYRIPHISTGDIFRRMIREKTSLGLEAESYISRGELVPDQVTIRMVRTRLQESDCLEGFILDGFPRTIEQAKALDAILGQMGKKLTAVLNVVVSEELILHRLTGRRHCPECGRGYNMNTMPPRDDEQCDDCQVSLEQRDDDNPQTIRSRLQTYARQTLPLLEYYQKQDMMLDIDNSGKPGENLDDVKRQISKMQTKKREP